MLSETRLISSQQKQFSRGHTHTHTHSEVLDNVLIPFIAWHSLFTFGKFSYFHAGSQSSALQMSSECSEMPVLLKAKRQKARSTRSLFLGSLVHSRDLNPVRDYFHVIGADVVPVPFSIFGPAFWMEGTGVQSVPLYRRQITPQNSTNTPVQCRAAIKAKQFVQHE